jgi:hypothetical protein
VGVILLPSALILTTVRPENSSKMYGQSLVNGRDRDTRHPLLSMTKIQKYSRLDSLAKNIVFDKIPGLVYYFRCVYRGLSGYVSLFEESIFTLSSIHRNVVLLSLASHLSQRLSIGAEL